MGITSALVFDIYNFIMSNASKDLSNGMSTRFQKLLDLKSWNFVWNSFPIDQNQKSEEVSFFFCVRVCVDHFTYTTLTTRFSYVLGNEANSNLQ